MQTGPADVLEVREVYKRFGGIEALRGVSIRVRRGELFGVIGPNGAGKTVLLNVITAIYAPDGGEVFVNSVPINGMRPHEVAKLGVARTFQITRYFPEMTVLQNVLTALYATRRDMNASDKLRVAVEALEAVGLGEVKDLKAKSLSGGQKKLLEFARLIASNANLLLLDEPFAGVNPIIIGRMVKVLKELAERGVSIVVVSHELNVVSKLCNRVAVLSRGEKIAEGSLREVALMQEVKRAYLGS
ncbi:MAG: ABC transporter ATP-binding protein [Candidatus Caldarchaeales archaeon]